MSTLIDLTGQKFGKLTVVAKAEPYPSGMVRWLCKCECGNTVSVGRTHLRSNRGIAMSCGKVGCKKGTKHGLSKKSPTYNNWKSMIARCYHPRHDTFIRYGGKGIQVFNEWLDFVGFLRDMGERPAGTVLDRIDNDGNYEPSNCRWASYKLSTENRRNTVWIAVGENRMRVKEIALIAQIPATRVYSRLRAGWSVDDIIKFKSTPHGYNRFGVPSCPNSYK